MTWKSALTRAINEEVAAEKAATQAESERRRAWWATTWALALVPRAEWAEAQTLYVQKTNHNKSTAEHRRRTGTRFTETALASGLPNGRFAEVASNWVGKDGDEVKVKEAVRLLAEAEKNEQSIREFKLALTGKPWTNAPENMTEADEDAVVEKVATRRPQVVAQQATKPAVGKAIANIPQATKSVIKGRSDRTKDINEKRKKAAAAAPAAAAQTAAVVDAGQMAAAGFPSNSPQFTRIESGIGYAWSGWLEGLRKQLFTDMDRSHMAAVLPSFERLLEQIRTYVEAEDDPYEAVKQWSQEHRDQFNLEIDLAENGVDISSIDEIERFANEASAS